MAGIALTTYNRARRGRIPRARTLKALENALRGKVRVRRPDRRDVPLAYNGHVAELCRRLGADAEKVLESDPGQRANSDPAWAAAARIRALAVYCTAIEFDVPAAAVARAIGVTRAAASAMLRRVEDLRDDPEIDALVERAGMLISGRAA
jgi:hypothetical protein